MLHRFPIEIDESLKNAYQLFVKRIAAKEASSKPIGILRPGIIDLIRKLDHTSIHNVGIYSNNPYKQNVCFIRDLIHQTTTRSIIGPCIHWDHPMRDIDHQLQKYATKTWVTLRSILIEHGAPYDLEPQDVVFFDDQTHSSMETSLDNNYGKVSEYYAEYHICHIEPIYLSCIQDANVDSYALFKCLVEIMDLKDIYQPMPNSVNYDQLIDLIYLLSEKSIYNIQLSPTEDAGLKLMEKMIDRLLPASTDPEREVQCLEKCNHQ